MRRIQIAVALITVAAFCAERPGREFRLKLRSRVEAFKGSGEWTEVQFDRRFANNSTAVIICDMWDNHWCRGAAQRVDVLAQKMAPVVDRARSHGILIVHAPSETMAFYERAPQRLSILAVPAAQPPAALGLADPPLPIDDSNGGCDTGGKFYKAWTREHAAIHIGEGDLISDKGDEIYSALRLRGIQDLLIMGVHTNMCILKRSFAIRQMTNWGMHCVLVRDLTDSMYNPQDRPFVSHDQGTDLVIQHIEKYWGPSTLSADLTKALE